MERTQNNKLIADTSGLVSLVVPNDQNHTAAVAAAKKLRTQQTHILIPSAVFYELLNILGRKVGHMVAAGTVSALTPPFILLSDPEQATIDQAISKFTAAPQSVSFTDCLVMAIADTYQTRQIFGFDKQFADADYHRLTPSTDWSKAA